MNKKILYTATSDVHLRTFHFPYLKWLIHEGYEVHVACENRGDVDLSFCHKVYFLPFKRNPINRENFISFGKLKKIIAKNNYDLIHCHTPTVSVLTRLAAMKSRRYGTKVLYTVHGFHFYKGAALRKWVIYYPIEFLLSKFTDGIITMNNEDFQRVNDKMLHKKSFYIPGMGVDRQNYYSVDTDVKNNLRKKYGYNTDDFIVIYIAEFIPRKNHDFILKCLVNLKDKIPTLKVLFAGKGDLLSEMEKKAKVSDLSDNIDFLGFRNDIPKLINISDIGISSSKQEGLPIGVLQLLFSGLPVLVSKERGHNDIVIHGFNGYLFEQDNMIEFQRYLEKLYKNKDLLSTMGENSNLSVQQFEINKALSAMGEIYNQYLSINDSRN